MFRLTLILLHSDSFPKLLEVTSGSVSVHREHCNLKGYLEEQLRRDLGLDIGVTIEGGIHLMLMHFPHYLTHTTVQASESRQEARQLA